MILDQKKLPTNTTTQYHAIHRWFNFIAGFSPELVWNCCEKANLDDDSKILDPFAGCGTTLVEACKHGLRCFGYEPNPFFCRITQGKLPFKNCLESLEKIEYILLNGFKNPQEISIKTLYQIAMEIMNDSIGIYLQLSEATNGLTNVTPNSVSNTEARELLLAGLGVINTEMSSDQAVEEWKRRQALKFDTETAVTFSVYRNIRQVGTIFFEKAYEITDGFQSFSSESIHSHPYLLPIFQHLNGIFSKSALKKQIGSISDTSISRPASERLAKLLEERVIPSNINRGEVLQQLEATLEGIVRDLVGRILLESIVENALNKRGINFERESEYTSLPGVVYNFRADFVIPDSNNTL
ncbi:DNA methyltransferase [Limnoraphis robusta]|uniref:DNA methyltransferase n=1 Tax=Limnoraphis robusta CCNP1315 TaxID=3110306 RepID=A0ABU5U4K3_9CYAN|nr:DNA methyltransferase [Limnoraphis robusta]MEA5521995.1 DNA methyltransferase [Limnoraphis robusta CCNP1315]MEA5545238.1 DNA methyltransferase [Limnoraphis robusta CCNP1324]